MDSRLEEGEMRKLTEESIAKIGRAREAKVRRSEHPMFDAFDVEKVWYECELCGIQFIRESNADPWDSCLPCDQEWVRLEASRRYDEDQRRRKR